MGQNSSNEAGESITQFPPWTSGTVTETPYPSTRADAIMLRTKYYFTGTPCRNGHLSIRYTKHAKCVVCAILQSTQWRAQNSGFLARLNQDKRKQRNQRYVEGNRDKIRERNRAAYAKNPSPKRVAASEWQKRNPAKVAVRTENRRAREQQAEGTHTPNDINRIRHSQHNKCAWCKTPLQATDTHIDHILPLSRGGSNWPRNLQLLCRQCNQRKHALDPIEWARRNGRLC